MEKLCCYRSDTYQHFGRYHVSKVIFVAAILMAITQLYQTIAYLTWHVWYWFITMGFIIGANLALFFAIKNKNTLLLKLVLVYQLLYTILCFLSMINMFYLLGNPHHSFLWRHCEPTYYFNKNGSITGFKNCNSKIKELAGIYAFVYFVFGAINLWCLAVVWNYHQFLTQNNSSSRFVGQDRYPAHPPAYQPATTRTTPAATSPSNPNQPPPPTQTTTISPVFSTGTSARVTTTYGQENPGFNSQTTTVTTPLPPLQPVLPDWNSAPYIPPPAPVSYQPSAFPTYQPYQNQAPPVPMRPLHPREDALPPVPPHPSNNNNNNSKLYDTTPNDQYY